MKTSSQEPMSPF